MMLDAGSTGRAGSGSSVWRRHSTHGADIVTVCRAILAPGSGRYLGELGFRAAEVEHAPGIANQLLAHESVLSLTYSTVSVGRLIGGIADAFTDAAQFQALDALLDVAGQYALDHDASLHEYHWTSSVLPRLDSLETDEPPGISPAGRRALLAAYRAYEARWAVVAGILQTTASAVAGGRPEGTYDLELLAVLIGRRSFFQLARRFRSVLDGDEQTH
jgi:hypothetical protein